MEQELTVEELIALVNSQKGDFIIRIEFGEEAGSGVREERLQTCCCIHKACEGGSDLFGAVL